MAQTPSPARQRSSVSATIPRRSLLQSPLVDAISPYVILGLLVAAWQLATSWQLVMPFLLPPPWAVLQWIIDDVRSGNLAINVAITLYRTFMGFLLAALVGVTIGILMTRVVPVRWFFDPILSFGLPLPKVALLPIFMLWFGLFDASKILLVAFSASFQIIAST
jgi:ABC-type nitrate/sulfonate/bicarbonate transport system permease component